MGITRIPFPTTLFGKPLALSTYPKLSGVVSCVLDSYLVAMLIGRASVKGSEKDVFKFRLYTMAAALIGGLGLYFGEVYFLARALMYNMVHWYDMIPVWPPVILFLIILGRLTARLDVTVANDRDNGAESTGGDRKKANTLDYVEFAGFVILLLVLHDPIMCMGIFLMYAVATGQGEDMIQVIFHETERSVFGLLIFTFIFEAAISKALVVYFPGYLVYVASGLSAVMVGAVLPPTGDVWWETTVLATGVLLSPVSALVGIMLFKRLSEWGRFFLYGLPLAATVFLIFTIWFTCVWPFLDPYFYQYFPRPAVVATPR
jgi:hypothetical protein